MIFYGPTFIYVHCPDCDERMLWDSDDKFTLEKRAHAGQIQYINACKKCKIKYLQYVIEEEKRQNGEPKGES
jgi:hypothetical protein